MDNIDPNIIQETSDALYRALETEQRNKMFVQSIGPAIVHALGPVLADAISKISINVNPEISIPEIKVPDIHIPETIIPPITLPEYKPPVYKVPPIKIPKTAISIKTDSKSIVSALKDVKKAVMDTAPIPFEMPKMQQWSFTKPQPVILTDAEGKPYMAGSS